MAVPKKKTSVSRKGKRRSGQHHRLDATTPMKCPNCGDHTLPHRACSSCGTYKGHEIIKIKAASSEEETAQE